MVHILHWDGSLDKSIVLYDSESIWIEFEYFKSKEMYVINSSSVTGYKNHMPVITDLLLFFYFILFFPPSQWFPSRILLTRTTGQLGPTSLEAQTSKLLETIWQWPTPIASARLWRRKPATVCCWKSIRSALSLNPWERTSTLQTSNR